MYNLNKNYNIWNTINIPVSPTFGNSISPLSEIICMPSLRYPLLTSPVTATLTFMLSFNHFLRFVKQFPWDIIQSHKPYNHPFENYNPVVFIVFTDKRNYHHSQFYNGFINSGVGEKPRTLCLPSPSFPHSPHSQPRAIPNQLSTSIDFPVLGISCE